jgi:hypothetical protein
MVILSLLGPGWTEELAFASIVIGDDWELFWTFRGYLGLQGMFGQKTNQRIGHIIFCGWNNGMKSARNLV